MTSLPSRLAGWVGRSAMDLLETLIPADHEQCVSCDAVTPKHVQPCTRCFNDELTAAEESSEDTPYCTGCGRPHGAGECGRDRGREGSVRKPVTSLYVKCSMPLRKDAVALSDMCGRSADTAVEMPNGDFMFRCQMHRGVIGLHTAIPGPVHETVPVRKDSASVAASADPSPATPPAGDIDPAAPPPPGAAGSTNVPAAVSGDAGRDRGLRPAAGHLVELIAEVLAEHRDFSVRMEAVICVCGEPLTTDGYPDRRLREHVAPLIAERVEKAAPPAQVVPRTHVDDLGRRWEWCGGVEGTWAWRITALSEVDPTP